MNGHYIVNGQKIWTSRAEHSDLLMLLARTTPKEEVKNRKMQDAANKRYEKAQKLLIISKANLHIFTEPR